MPAATPAVLPPSCSPRGREGRGGHACSSPTRRCARAAAGTPRRPTGRVQVLPRSAVDVADVEITGLDAAGIADVGLAAAGLDLTPSASSARARATPPAPKPWPGDAAGAIAQPAPRTTEMRAVTRRAGRQRGAPRRAVRPPTAAVRRDRHARRPGGRRPVRRRRDRSRLALRHQPPGRRSAPARRGAAAGSLASLFTDPCRRKPADEPATEVHAAEPASVDDDADEEEAGAPRTGDLAPAAATTAEPTRGAAELAGPATVFDQTGGLEVVTDEQHEDVDDARRRPRRPPAAGGRRWPRSPRRPRWRRTGRGPQAPPAGHRAAVAGRAGRVGGRHRLRWPGAAGARSTHRRGLHRQRHGQRRHPGQRRRLAEAPSPARW